MKRLWIIAGAAILAAFLLSRYCVQIVRVNGGSMEPTYHDGQLVLMNKLDKEYSRGEVIVFYSAEYGRYLIKRIYALPGEEVDIADMTLGEDEYYVLGDNRDNSIDSRDEHIGAVRRENIQGTVIGGLKELP